MGKVKKYLASLLVALAVVALLYALMGLIGSLLGVDPLIARLLDASTSCIEGTQVTFLVRNVGTSKISGDSIKCFNIETGASEALTWQYLNGTVPATSPVIKPGEAIKAKIANNCTTPGVAKVCKYELTLTGTTWKQDLPEYCAG